MSSRYTFYTFYTIYKITNKVNNKTYIGLHRTNDLNDGYLGSGTYIRKAVKKYGANNFSKEILFIFDNEQEMIDKEVELVNEECMKDRNTYNSSLGGKGSWSHIEDKQQDYCLVTTSLDAENIWVHKEDSRIESGELKHPNYFTNKNREYTSRDESKIIGKEIHIFNEFGDVVFRCIKNFDKVCRENGLPKKSFVNSYENNSSKLFQTPRQLSACKRLGHEKFIGWSAKVVNDRI